MPGMQVLNKEEQVPMMHMCRKELNLRFEGPDPHSCPDWLLDCTIKDEFTLLLIEGFDQLVMSDPQVTILFHARCLLANVGGALRDCGLRSMQKPVFAVMSRLVLACLHDVGDGINCQQYDCLKPGRQHPSTVSGFSLYHFHSKHIKYIL